MEILIVSIVACAIALWIDYLIAREFYFAAQEKGYSGKKNTSGFASSWAWLAICW